MMRSMDRLKKRFISLVNNLLIFIFPIALGLIVGQGDYKTILQLVGVLSHGKTAKRLTDKAIDLMQDVQNLRRAIYEFVLYLFI